MKTPNKSCDNIGHVLSEVVGKHADSIAITESSTGKEVTFEQANSIADSYATFLTDEGVMPGDRVILMVKPSIDFICMTFALFKLGVVIVLIDPGMGIRNLKDAIIRVKPTVLVGVPKALLFKKLFPRSFKTVKKSFCCGFSFGLFGADVSKSIKDVKRKEIECKTQRDDLAAIIFTSGSTGIPKGVHYRHSTFGAQLRLIRDYYRVKQGDRDQPAFPLFGLFSIALGAQVIIPDMDPTRPAKVNPEVFVDSIMRHQVTYSFGSPALWKVVSEYCMRKRIVLHSMKLVLIAGAPVPGWLVGNMLAILPENAKLHTPYGATESLPIVSIEGKEIVSETWPKTREGKGICVGRPLPGIEIEVIRITDDPIDVIENAVFIGTGEVGEIIVKGDVVTTGYDHCQLEDRLSKIADRKTFYHRMGDTGYLDEQGRLWFCGRKNHRVVTEDGTFFPICCEAVTNEHRSVSRSALVGIVNKDKPQYSIPVLIVEPEKDIMIDHKQLLNEARSLAAQSKLTKGIDHFLVHPEFPVDIRHNAKIVREELAAWAQKKIATLQ